jgi:chorismate mutase/prephenate dehydratase
LKITNNFLLLKNVKLFVVGMMDKKSEIKNILKILETILLENDETNEVDTEKVIQKLNSAFKEKDASRYISQNLINELILLAKRIYIKNENNNHFEKSNREQITVAYQGIDGAYSHIASQKFFSDKDYDVLYIGLPTFQAILDSVEEGESDYAVLPIENTTAGSINESIDLLSNRKLHIIGEEFLEINHCLLAIDDIPLGRIKTIYSHPQALAQCSIFLSSLENCKVESFFDTAMAIKKVKEDQNLTQAAIGSSEAARIYGLKILKDNISNTRENYTRFFIISKKPVVYDESIPCKTSLLFATKHVEGALVRCLNILAKHHLNLTKIQSRPRQNVPWEYIFHIDFEGNTNTDKVKIALNELTAEVSYIKILGSYPIKILPGYLKTFEKNDQEKEPIVLEDVKEIPRPEIKILEKKPYRLAGRYYKQDDTLIRVRDCVIGGNDFIVIAGPCSVESKTQIFDTAKIVAENGANLLRGGVFKPRTSPYSFQGLGYEGLELLSQAGREYNLPIVTEVLRPEDVQRIAMVADVLQIGARNMQNFPLLNEVGSINKPVLLKRGLMASIDEFLSAAEYILNQGNQQVILCERGIRTFETATRNTLDLSAIPIIKHYSHLPIIVDPSHAIGDWRYIIPMVEASIAAGAHGVMVEIHPEPEKALSDGAQSLKFDNFKIMMQRVRKIKQSLNTV